MKLWIKISLLTGIVMTLAMGVFGGFLIYETGQNNVKQTVENSLQQLQRTGRKSPAAVQPGRAESLLQVPAETLRRKRVPAFKGRGGAVQPDQL